MDLTTLGLLNQGRETPTASATTAGATPDAPTDQRFNIIAAVADAASADVYHATPASPTLLTQRGVGAYLNLLNAAAGDELHRKSADLLTTSLRSASTTLRATYYEAVSRLPPELVSKDWSFSVSNGTLVFTPHQDELSAQDLTQLRNVFAKSNVEYAAKQVRTAITSIVQMRKAGADSG